MEYDKIEYSNHCDLCDEHKTDLGIAMNWWHSVQSNFPDLSVSEQLTVWKTLYEQTKLDMRTAQIQGYKKANIKEINR